MVTEHLRGSAGVPGELIDPAQVSEVGDAIVAGTLAEVALTDPEELELFADLNRILGRGESAAIAAAQSRNWLVATDDRRARAECERRLGPNRVVNTPGILLACILDGALEVEEADAIKDLLAASRFVMKFRSFADLLDGSP